MDIYRLAGPPVYCFVGDLDWWHALDPSDLAAMRGLCDGDEVDLMVHPGYRHLEDEMLAWAEDGWRERAGAEDQPAVQRAWCHDTDIVREALLQRRGYARSEAHFRIHRRDLAGPQAKPSPAPELPPGYSIRPCRGEKEIEQRVAVHRDAFAPSKMTVEKHRNARRGLTYRPDLDLVAVAPDGAFAAFTIVWFDEANRIGVFEPVGTHSAHRRLGLGRAMLHEGMRRLVALGGTTAFVVSWSENEGSARLYESTGLMETYRDNKWTKTL